MVPRKRPDGARYTYDINRPGMLHAKILRCPHAHARIRTIDSAAAEKLPGFRPLHDHGQAGGRACSIAGAPILAVACDTEEQCDDVLRAIRIDYEVLPFQVKEEDGMRLRRPARHSCGRNR